MAETMQPADVVTEFNAAGWTGPFGADDTDRALAALESGRVIFLPRLRFELLSAEQAFLTDRALDDTRKNISFDPATGRCHGSGYEGEKLAALTAMLDRFGRGAEALVRGLLPRYAPSLERARTSFRPAEIAGRSTTPRHDDKRLHVDAFPTRPMRGRRILRLFANIAPDGVVREWRVGEPFPDFAAQFLPQLRPMPPGQAWLMNLLGLTKGQRSAYDHLMLGLHDAGKLDGDYQANAPRAAVSFPPGSTWMCFTDSVLHAALAGRCALEQTFHIPVDAMAEPARSPLKVLERLSGRTLV
jgi:hypothetical protein